MVTVRTIKVSMYQHKWKTTIIAIYRSSYFFIGRCVLMEIIGVRFSIKVFLTRFTYKRMGVVFKPTGNTFFHKAIVVFVQC